MRSVTKIRKKWLIDALVIILHITYGMSMVKVIILDPLHIPYYIDIIILTFIAYGVRFGFSFKLVKAKKNSFFIFFIILYIADIFQNFFTEAAGSAFVRILYLLDLLLFMEYIYSMFIESKDSSSSTISKITGSFELYAVYNVFVTILCTLLLLVGILSPTSNPIQVNSLTASNVSVGAQYYFPGYLSMHLGIERGLVDLGIPVLTGLSHEPHVLFLLIGPAFFFLLKRQLGNPIKTTALYISYLMLLIISTATTAIVVFALCMIIEQIYSLSLGGKKRQTFVVLGSIFLIFYWFVSSQGIGIFETIANMVVEKSSVGINESSKGYSYSMLYYMVSPEGIFGHGNMPLGWGFNLHKEDIGFISCILDIAFYIMFLYYTLKNVISKDITNHYCGMALLYFLLHSLKLGVQIFSFQYLAFFVVLIVILNQITSTQEPISQTSKM